MEKGGSEPSFFGGSGRQGFAGERRMRTIVRLDQLFVEKGGLCRILGWKKEQFRFFSLTSAVDWGNIKDGFGGEGNCRLGGLGVCGGYQGTLECQERS